MLKVVYMGTPQFAVPALEALIQGSAPGIILPDGLEVVCVITRPDKPVGRGKEIVFSPVKQTALAHEIPVWQPGSLKREENIAALAEYQADIYIVAAFGQILPQAVLDQPRYGTLNIHASLLPKYRGVSPITAAILQGDVEAGVTIMLLDAGVDTGPMVRKGRIPIANDDTTGTLTAKLADLGAKTLVETLPDWIAGKITPEPQADELSTHTHMLTKEHGLINWERPAAAIARAVRAYNPWPSAYSHWRGKQLKIVTAHVLEARPSRPLQTGILCLQYERGKQVLAVVTGSGLLVVDRLQLEGKKVMSADEFLRGYAQCIGEVLA